MGEGRPRARDETERRHSYPGKKIREGWRRWGLDFVHQFIPSLTRSLRRLRNRTKKRGVKKVDKKVIGSGGRNCSFNVEMRIKEKEAGYDNPSSFVKNIK